MTENGNVPLLISVESAGKLLGIGRGLAYQLAREGKLPTVRLGRRTLISRQHLEVWIAHEVRDSTSDVVSSGGMLERELKEV